MLDLESLSTDTDTAPILSIGMVAFDPCNTHEDLENAPCWYHVVTLTDQYAAPFHAVNKPDTVEWWEQQGGLQWHTTASWKLPVSHVLNRVVTFWQEQAPAVVWSRGLYDTQVLAAKFRQAGRETPWTYSQPKDVRTMETVYRLMFGIPPDDPTVFPSRPADWPAHHALYDCLYQALCVRTWLADMRRCDEYAGRYEDLM